MADDFDPAKYLAEKTGKAPATDDDFDPAKYLSEKAALSAGPQGPPGTSIPNTALHQGLGGLTAGWSDEAGGLGTALIQGGANMLPADFAKAHDISQAPVMDAYRDSRDRERALLAAQAQENPKTALASQVVGQGALAAIAPGLSATGQGAISGLGNSDTDLTTGDPRQYLQAGVDTGKGAAAGYLAGKLGEKVISPAIRGLGNTLENAGISQGRRAISAVGSPLSTKKELPDGAVRQVLDEKLLPWWGSVRKIADNLGKARQEAGENVGEIVDNLGDRGVAGPNKLAMIKQLQDKLQALRENGNVNPSVRGAYKNALAELEDVPAKGPVGIAPAAPAPTPPGANLPQYSEDALRSAGITNPRQWAQEVSDIWGEAPLSSPQAVTKAEGAAAPRMSASPTMPAEPAPAVPAPESNLPPQNFALRQAENIKQSQQGLVNYEQPVSSPQNLAHKDIASGYRQAVEDSISKQAAASNDPAIKNLAADFIPAKDRAGNLIAAHDVAQAGAARFAKAGAWMPGLKDLAAGASMLKFAGPLGPVASYAARRYAAGGAARAMYGVGTTVGKLSATLESNPAAFGKYAGALINARQSGGQSGLAAAHFTLSQSDPDYQAIHANLPDAPDKNE